MRALVNHYLKDDSEIRLRKKSGIRRIFSPHEVRCAASGGGAEVGFARVAWASSLQLAANDQPTVARGLGG
ncbi:MAG: hypothetical protein FWF81_03495, partial [Defluviitaleaceae bacterium]|nr:hypothetical protein [Defluviitaleaceae bacterium]